MGTTDMVGIWISDLDTNTMVETKGSIASIETKALVPSFLIVEAEEV